MKFSRDVNVIQKVQKTVKDAEAQHIGKILDVPVAETTQLCGESGHIEMSRPNPTPRVL